MQVCAICNGDGARDEAGANENPSEINDNGENEGSEDDEEEKAVTDCSDKRKKECRKWTVIGRWDATALPLFEI
jgi:hypothetical protein